VDAVLQLVKKAKVAEAGLKSEYARVLIEVRSGTSKVDQLWQLLKDSANGEISPQNIVAITEQYRRKMDFADMYIAKSVTYIGYNSSSLDIELMNSKCDDAYVLYFNEQVMNEQSTWDGNLLLLHELLSHGKHDDQVIIYDCDAKGSELEKSYISQYRNRQCLVQDVLEQKKLTANLCLIRYNEKLLDRTGLYRPEHRRAMKIPCPGRYCSLSISFDWYCFKCYAPIEYGYTD
jgi:hypothetical protein